MAIFEKVLVFILTSAQALAAADLPLVASSQISDADLRVRAQATDRKTLSEFFDVARPGAANERKLGEKLERAQRAWLGGSEEVATGIFRDLTELSLRADWRDSQRASLLYAHLRLAQLANSPTERNDWLVKGARVFHDLEPDASLFPPPLIAEFKEIRAQVLAKSAVIGLREVFPGFRYVYVDGLRISLEGSGRARVSPGAHRVTAVSDRHAPLTEEMTAAQLGVFRVKVNPLADGCPTGAQALPDGTAYEVFAGDACTEVTSPFRATAPPNDDWAKPPMEVTSRAKRDWLWLGAIALGTAAVIAIQKNQKNASPTPVHREGF